MRRGGAVGIAGAVFVAAAVIIDAIQAAGRQRAAAEEKAAEARKSMAWGLDQVAVAVNNLALPAPVRQAAAKTDAAFDAVVAAELQAPRPPARNRTPPPVR